jgi:hypothetical protein
VIAGELIVICANTTFDFRLNEAICSWNCWIEVSFLFLHDIFIYFLFNDEYLLQLFRVYVNFIVNERYNVHKILNLSVFFNREIDNKISLAYNDMMFEFIAFEDKH